MANSGEQVAKDIMPSAKMERTGFLHLPNEIRNRIYEDAIFDHDHGTVMLPRALPRKVTADGKHIAVDYLGQNHLCEDLPDILGVAGLSSSVLYDECLWVEGERPPEEIPLPIFTEELTDDESWPDEPSDMRGWMTASGRRLTNSERYQRSFTRTRKAAAETEEILDAVDVCDDCGEVDCTCIAPGDSTDEEAGMENPEEDAASSSEASSEVGDDEHGGIDEDGYLMPPKNCMIGRCSVTNKECNFCGGFGLGPDQDEEMYFNDDNEEYDNRYKDDDPLEEDDEHYDSEEREGMLFRQQEPAILLACKEIREQCLPIYYGSNACSWRFFWLDQTKSLARFTAWTRVVGKRSKNIREISFEGRHSVEEGIEFGVDIDLLEETPYFDVKAECHHPGDELTDAIVEAIEQDFITVLWKMSRLDRGKIDLSSDDLCQLGALFSEAMQR